MASAGPLGALSQGEWVQWNWQPHSEAQTILRHVSDLFSLPNELLLANIGREADPDLLLPRSFHDAVQAGRAWMEQHVEDLRQHVCPHQLDVSLKPDGLAAVAAIADLLASIKGLPAPASVATLLYRYGLARFCAGFPT